MIEALFAIALAGEEPVFVLPGTHPYTVSSRSMAPGLSEGEVIVASRSRGDCGSTRPTPGDVVIVRRDGHPWIRRIVAGAGQTVQMRDGVLHIDGVAVRLERVDDPVAAKTAISPFVMASTLIWRETLPNGRSYLTADFGPGQDLDDTPPLVVPEGHWFALGDNRDNSIDDRIDGPTSDADLCGVVTRIVRSTDPSRVGALP